MIARQSKGVDQEMNAYAMDSHPLTARPLDAAILKRKADSAPSTPGAGR